MIEDFRLKVFAAVVSERSFTGAARLLNISQPAVSQNIAELEKCTGKSLFDRSSREVNLTQAGAYFKLFADRIIKEYEGLNTVFNDYEAFVSILEKRRSLEDDPLYQALRESLPD